MRKCAREFEAISTAYFGAEVRLPAPNLSIGTFLSIRSQALNASGFDSANGLWKWSPQESQTLAAQAYDFKDVHLRTRVQALLEDAMARQMGGPAEMMRQRVSEFLRTQTRALLSQAQQSQPKRSRVNGSATVAGNRSNTMTAPEKRAPQEPSEGVVRPFPQEP